MSEEKIEAGRLQHFEENLGDLLNYAETLIKSDELEKAEWLLYHGMPGYYRDHPPEKVMALREKLYKFLMNVADYANAPDDIRMVSKEQGVNGVTYLLRGQLILKSVKEYNEKGITPHLFEMGPGEFWLPIGLIEMGCKFTYQASFLSVKAFEKAKEYLQDVLIDKPPTDRPHIFVACEIIEHLRSEKEIVHCMHKNGITPKEFHISTPMYTFAQGAINWDADSNKGLGGHLRTYTPHEFISVVSAMFQGYSLEYYPNAVQSIVGKKGTK